MTKTAIRLTNPWSGKVITCCEAQDWEAVSANWMGSNYQCASCEKKVTIVSETYMSQ